MPPGPDIEDLHFDLRPDVSDPPGHRTQELLDRQRDLESSAVQYPKELPLAVDSGRGATIRDVDGNVFLDLFAGIGVTMVGHANPYIEAGVSTEQDRFAHSLDFPSETRLELIENLRDLAPGELAENCRVLFGGPTGSDAIEASIKLAQAHSGGEDLIAFRGAYHGGTAGALALTADTEEKAMGPGLPTAHHLPYPRRDGPNPERATATALSELEAVLGDRYGGLTDPAGIWVEPIQGESGIILPAEGFLAGVRDRATAAGIPLIVDEIQTGIGRTGDWFAIEQAGVTPDIMPIAKGIANGHPLAATVYQEAIDDAVEPGLHAGTFRGALPSMRAAIRTLAYIEGHDLLAHARQLGNRIEGRLSRDVEPVESVSTTRGRGLYHAIEFRETRTRSATAIRDAVRQRCFEAGVLVWGGGRAEDAIRIIPPLIITEVQLEHALEAITRAVETVAGAAESSSHS